MQFIDLKTQQKRIRQDIESKILNVLDHGQYILGPEISELENKLASYVGIKHGIACSSGTDALLLALMALNIGRGDIVYTSPFTFIATAEVISLLGATPVFSDIDPVTYNIDPEGLEKTIISNKSKDLIPKAIIAVDLFGLPADYNALQDIAKKHNLFLIEDAAQSFGAEYKNKKACSFADISATSFFPAKPLGGYGDGGMVFTNNDDYENLIRSFYIHGQGNTKYENIRIGINGRLDTLQAAVLLCKFDIFPEEIEMRQIVANRYNEMLKNSNIFTTPSIPENYLSAWAQYSILCEDETIRTDKMDKLKNENIPTAIYYPIPLHLQKAFENLGYNEGDFPVCESIAKRIFSLPMHPYLSEQDQKIITDTLL